MLTENTMTPYDSKKLVRLKATRPLFVNSKRIEAGEEFEAQAQHAGEILATGRADFVNQFDRGLVYKLVEQF